MFLFKYAVKQGFVSGKYYTHQAMNYPYGEYRIYFSHKEVKDYFMRKKVSNTFTYIPDYRNFQIKNQLL